MKKDFILDSLVEIKKLQNSEAIEKVKSVLSISKNGPNDNHLSKLLEEIGVPIILIDKEQPNGINGDLNVLLHIHFLLKDAPALKTLELLCNYLKELPEEIKQVKGISRTHLYIVYQEYFDIVSWSDYLKKASLKSWDEVISLKNALPYCKVNSDDIFDLLNRCVINFHKDLAINSVAWTVCEKIKKDSELGKQVDSHLYDVLRNEQLQTFFPRLVNVVVNGDKAAYISKFNELSSWIEPGNCVTIMQALELACPDEPEYVSLYLPLLNAQLNKLNLTRADYINLSCSKQLSYQNVHDFAVEISRTLNDNGEIFAIVNHLVNFINHSDQNWFIEIAINAFSNPGAEAIHLLNNLIDELKEKNVGLVYELLTRRIEKIGALNFLGDSFEDLISINYDLFRKYLTEWFLSDNPKVHFALREICNLGNVPFELSQDHLSKLTSTEKLYIGVKVAGYVYSKENLQSLVLSLTRSIKSDEEALLGNIYTLYNQYIIYNYRTTLDGLRNELEQNKLPDHLKKLYTDLITAYENYFEQLRSIPDLMELRPDTKLTQNLHFYEQMRYDKIVSKKEDKGFLSMLKSVQIKSNKWAVRRPDQKVHEVQSLGHFSSSMEFPMGEWLNPTFQEKARRYYQKIRKHEINID